MCMSASMPVYEHVCMCAFVYVCDVCVMYLLSTRWMRKIR